MSNFKRLDKIYIISALILALGWGIWNFGGLNSIKLPKIKLYFISDFFAERTSLKSDEFICWDLQNYIVTSDYIIYFDPNRSGLFRMNRDGGENAKIIESVIYSFSVKDDWIYYASPDGGGGIFKIRLDGSQKEKILESGSINSAKVTGDYIYFTSGSPYLSRVTLKGKDRINFRTSTMGDAFPYGNYMYRIKQDTWEVYKSRAGETDEKLAFSFGRGVNRISLYKDFFYYLTPDGILYRRNIDGSKEIEIAKGLGNYYIDNDALYYSVYRPYDPSANLGGDMPSTLYRAKLDGSGSIEILSTNKLINSIKEGIAGLYGPTGELTFFNIEEKKEVAIPELEYEILVNDIKDRIGDTEVKSFGNNNGDFKFFSSGDYLYYGNYIINGINRYSKKDKKSTRLGKDQAYGFEMLGNLIFYRNARDGSLYCMNSDGSNPQKVFNYNINLFFPTREALYFTSTNSRLYKVRLEDNKIIKITDEFVGRFLIRGDYIYYNSYFPGSLFRVKLDGSSREKVSIPNLSIFNIVGNYIYFCNEFPTENKPMPSLNRERLDGDKMETIIENISFDFAVYGDHIYYIESIEGDQNTKNGVTRIRVAMCDMNGKNKKILNLENLQFFVDGEKIYIQNNLGQIEEKNLRDIIVK